MRTASPSLGSAVLAAIKTGGAYAIEPSTAGQFAAQSARDDGVLVGLECGTAIAAVSAAINGNLIRKDASVMVINTASLLKFDPMYLISSEA
jgi:threonine synthase